MVKLGEVLAGIVWIRPCVKRAIKMCEEAQVEAQRVVGQLPQYHHSGGTTIVFREGKHDERSATAGRPRSA